MNNNNKKIFTAETSNNSQITSLWHYLSSPKICFGDRMDRNHVAAHYLWQWLHQGPVTSSLHLSDGCGGIQHLALAVTASEVLQNLLATIPWVLLAETSLGLRSCFPMWPMLWSLAYCDLEQSGTARNPAKPSELRAQEDSAAPPWLLTLFSA